MGTAWNETRSGAVMGGAILVVEDEPAIQELIAVKNLEHADTRCCGPRTFPEAEALVREVLPDLVLLDWMLPGPPGVNFRASVARRLSVPRTSVITC